MPSVCVCVHVCLYVWYTLAVTKPIEGWQEEEEEVEKEEEYGVPGNHADRQEGLYSVNMF